MKNRKNLILFLAIIVIVAIGLTITYLLNSKSSSYKIADGITKIELKSDVQYDIDLEHLHVFDNYEDFSIYFNSESIKKDYFDSNNYAILILNYDECSYTNVVPTKYTVVGNKLNVTAYHDGFSTCEPLYAYYAVKVNKDITELNLNINWIARNKDERN